MNARARARLNFWMEIFFVLLFCSLVAAWLFISSTAQLGSEELAIQAGDLRSFAASGSLLSDQFSNGDLTNTFFREQLELIDDKVDSVHETLETSEVEPGFKNDAQKLRTLENRLDIILERMSAENTVGHGRELKDIAGSLKSLEENLKKGAHK